MYINLDKENMNLYEQVYEEIKNLIIDRNLVKGDKLPSIRKLAEDYNISKNTVRNAYYQLEIEGFISPRDRRGFFVNEIDNLIVLKEKNIDSQRLEKPQYRYDFSSDGVDSEGFPYSIWSKLFRENFSYDDGSLLSQGEAKGYYPLRKQIAKYVNSSRGLDISPEDLIISAGTEHLFYILEGILKEDSIFGFEDPGYAWGNPFFFYNQPTAVPLPLDSSGVRISDLEENKVNACWVTPAHQFPLGHIMPIKRRVELLNWAAKNPDNYIIEDDYDGEFKFRGRPVPALKSMDKSDLVIYIGNFSRCLSPSLRVSYMALPKKLMDRYNRNFQGFSCSCSHIIQKVLADFMREGYFEKHINRMRTIYSKKHGLMKEILDEIPGLEIIADEAGTSFVVSIKTDKKNEVFLEDLRKEGVNIIPIKNYSFNKTDGSKYLIGFTKLNHQEIIEGLNILKNII